MVLPVAFEFLPTQQNRAINLTIIDDIFLEIDEDFALTVFKDTSAIPNVGIAPGRGRTTINIIDNESIHNSIECTSIFNFS